MSLRRSSYDGGNSGGGPGTPEWRNPFNSEIETDQFTPSKRTRKTYEEVNNDGLFHEEGDKDRYLITYSDLITLLLGLFIILYAISSIDIKKYEKMMGALGNAFGAPTEVFAAKPKEKIIVDPSKIPATKEADNQWGERLEKMITDRGYQDDIKLIHNERGMTVRIMDDILFRSGDAVLSTQAKEVLANIAGIIKNIPNDIRIEGHTDNLPINTPLYPSNWHLSVSRATNTAYFLMNDQGVSPEKVSIVGYSSYKPVAENETIEGKALNRRVDIVILKK